jgi:hypothetical protein
MRIGAAVTALGLVFLIIACLPLFFPSLQLPSIMWGLAMITGIGIIIIVIGLFLSAGQRASRR